MRRSRCGQGFLLFGGSRVRPSECAELLPLPLLAFLTVADGLAATSLFGLVGSSCSSTASPCAPGSSSPNPSTTVEGGAACGGLSRALAGGSSFSAGPSSHRLPSSRGRRRSRRWRGVAGFFLPLLFASRLLETGYFTSRMQLLCAMQKNQCLSHFASRCWT
jgi:hypothetical protein